MNSRRIEEVRSEKSEVGILHSLFCPLTSIFFLLLTTSCQAQKPSKPYYEDLSLLRPKVTLEETKPKDSAATKKVVMMVTPTHTVNTKVDAILDSIDKFNLTRKFIDGFTIQIYSGQKREEALNASKKLAESISSLRSTTQYQQPKFKVTVGKYYSRLEAQKDLLRLRRTFSSAILVPERIMIK